MKKKKQDPSGLAHRRSHNHPGRLHADSVRQEEVYAEPQKASARSAASTIPGINYFRNSTYIYMYHPFLSVLDKNTHKFCNDRWACYVWKFLCFVQNYFVLHSSHLIIVYSNI